MQVKKQQLELNMKQWTGSKLGKSCAKAVYSHLFSFKFYGEYIIQNAELNEPQVGIEIAGRNVNTSDMEIIQLQWWKVKES